LIPNKTLTFVRNFGSDAYLYARMKRESGANPEQSRCCKLQSDHRLTMKTVNRMAAKGFE
jgi:hypothetical protein